MVKYVEMSMLQWRQLSKDPKHGRAILQHNVSYYVISITSEGTTQIDPNLDLLSKAIPMAAALSDSRSSKIYQVIMCLVST